MKRARRAGALLAGGALLSGVLALPLGAQKVEDGKKVYDLKCAQCHGREGTPFVKSPEDPSEPQRDESGRAVVDAAKAPAAPFVLPRPRDFTKGSFKVRSTPSGEIPTDEDLARIVSDGMPGSSMPAWKDALAPSEVRDVVAYLKTFSARFKEEKPSKVLDMSGAARSDAGSIEKGRALYIENGCNACHGELGRGDGLSAPTLVDDWGNPVPPANFHKPWTLRGGSGREDIFRTFMMGLNGTPMPSYLDVFGDTPEGREKGWHLANYIESLGAGRPNLQQVLRGSYEESLPSGPEDPAWEKVPPVDFLLVGQVVAEPRQFTPSIDRVAARLFYNDGELALHLEWDDRVRDDADALEVQVPRRFAPPPGESTEPEKPYFLKGDKQHPVELWRFEAKADKVSSWTSTGPRSKPERLEGSGVVVSSASYRDGLWRLQIRRKLAPPEGAGVAFKPGWFVPVAFFAWDGSNGDSGLKGSVSTWNYLLLEPRTPKLAYALPVLALLAAAGLQAWLLGRKKPGKP